MPRGSKPGERRGGRQKGIPNKKTQEKIAAIENSGLTPLDFLLQVMRNPERDMDMRVDAGKAAAPYVHPKLANIELTGKDKGPLEVNIVRFSDAAQPVGSETVPDARLGGARTGVSPRHPTLASPKR